MKRRKFLFSFIIVLTFIGGFITGGLYTTNKNLNNNKMVKIKQAPKSESNPLQKNTPNKKGEKPKVLIGYVQDFRSPNQIDYTKLTHVIFSFAHPTKDGQLLLNGDIALKNLRTIVSKAHKQDKKVILAVGGWFHIQGGESYPYFKEAITNPASRNKLINELVSITDREKLDGIDIDFEHPRTMDDAHNLAVFTRDLSKALHQKGKELSVAVNAKIHSVQGTEINNVIFSPSMFKYVDHVNIMAYDGQWDGGYHAENLSPYPYVENIVNYWSNLFDTQNLPKEKLILGIPFYGQPENPAIKQVSYEAIIANNPANANQDTVNMNGTKYHYNGTRTVEKKTILALNHGFGGIMLWEAGHDAKGPHSLTSVISEVLEKRIFALK